MVVWWLRLHAFKAEDLGSIPGWRTKILHAYGMAKNLEKEKSMKKLFKKKKKKGLS